MVRLLFLAVVQLSTIFLLIVQVAANTKSNKLCTNDKDTLQLIIRTCDKRFAGTDDIIHLLLRSGSGVICRANNLNNPGNDRERNSVDEYMICCPKEFLMDERELSMLAFTQMALMARKQGRDYDHWCIQHIEVRAGKRVLLSNPSFFSATDSRIPWLFGVSKINSTRYIHF